MALAVGESFSSAVSWRSPAIILMGVGIVGALPEVAE